MSTPSTKPTKTVVQRLLVHINPSVDISLLIQKLCNTISVSPGFNDFYWGKTIEDPSKCEILCLWDSKSAQDAYPSSPHRERSDFLIWKMSTQIPKCHYLPLQNWSPLLSAPIVEMLSFSQLPFSLPTSTFTDVTDFIRSRKGCLGTLGAKTFQYGDDPEEGRFLIMVGWESVAAHEGAKSVEGFAKLPGWVWKIVEMHHVKWEKVSPGGDGGMAML